MIIFKKLFSKYYYRSPIFWLLSLLSLYSAFGFLILPKLIHNGINEQIQIQLGWKTEIAEVKINPFLLTMTINELQIIENATPVFNFSRFHADIELRSLVEGAYTFKNIELIKPNINLSIAPNGMSNIQQAYLNQQLSEPPLVVSEEQSAPSIPKLLFDQINVEAGSIRINDFSQGEKIVHQLNPISFNIRTFSTYIEQGGDYQLNILLDNDQSLYWKGNLSLAPISSTGSFQIKGIRAHRLWAYLAKVSPYDVRNSEVDFSSNYSVSYTDSQLQLILNEAYVSLKNTNIADPQKTDEFVNIKQINIGPSYFDLAKQSVAIKQVELDTVDLDLTILENGELQLLQPLNTLTKQDEQIKKTNTENSNFLWSIDNIKLNNSIIHINDRSVANNANIRVRNINAELSQLNQSLANSQPFSLSFTLDESLTNEISGDITLQPLALQSDIKLSQIPVKIAQPYLEPFANIAINKGLFSLLGKTQLTNSETHGMNGSFQGDITVDDFDSQDTIKGRRLLGWEQIDISPLQVSFSPLRVDIDKILLKKPYSRFIINEDRSINFSQLTKNNSKNKSITSPTPKSAESTVININEIRINEGSTYFADLSLTPEFATSIQHLDGTIKGLSSHNDAPAEIDIKGSVDEYGMASINGEIKPLVDPLYTNINVNFDKVELTTLTPYSGRYAGYVIDKGKLSLALNYKIADGFLDGSNRLILDQFELGETVQSEESLDLPIKLALALFKDSDGIIDISLPTKGDMNSPDFEIGGLVMKALLNVMTKAVSSPFTLLANLADGDETSLNSVSFALGSSELSAEQKQNLATLASLLIKRPQLILEMRINVDSEKEAVKLKQMALQSQLQLINKDIWQQQEALEKFFIEQQGEQEFNDFKLAQLTVKESEPEVDQDELMQQYQQALFNHLVSIQPFSNLQLTELAQQRISSIKNELIKVNKVQNKQVFALHPTLDALAEKQTIDSIFTLTSK
ncbi:hypothetical protein CW745_02910 [Psychromonas sp. psych-6C06]|uniref:DUF748 domain-containing protein n=1 Tax=Psychromonas sp. psych-6C06 TaxID=2058089 RepID=UPI000C3341D3|nr:DUF748 domain-containing protein [Psychromonas sp. psych-6C06]PKF63805.1 hypothetical protein CW745_02910 [Psychromonas sp. psych-6C06]